jgi:NhaP-type Na+/H+ or K+/H+ antiporter
MTAHDELKQTLEFTDSDLATNREGRLSARQRERLQQMRLRSIWIGMAGTLVIALLATILLFTGGRNDSLILILAGIGVTICGTAVLGLFTRHWLRLGTDLQDDRVERLSGTVERTIRVSGRNAQYVLKIGKAEINLPKDTLNLFEHEAAYAIYRTLHGRVLLSAERLPKKSA